jgi:hypothetical protein
MEKSMTEKQRTCISCGQIIPLDATFCGFCGAVQHGVDPAPQPEPADFHTEAPTRLEQSEDVKPDTDVPEESLQTALEEETGLSTWKSPFWITLGFSFLILPALWFTNIFLRFWGTLFVSLCSGLLYAVLIRRRSGLENKRQFVGTILSAAGVWVFLFLLIGG